LTAYEILSVDGLQPETDEEVLQCLRDWGLRAPEKAQVADTIDEALAAHRRWAEERDRLDYEIDGMVIKVDDLGLRRKVGSTVHHPRWAIAYKFEPRREVTGVRDIVVQVGRTGILTPVALLRPVEVGGVTVSRASLHNREEVRRKDVRTGDTVRVQRAGDVIPEVVERIKKPGQKRRAPFKMPSRCPSCGSELVEQGPYTVCPNRFRCPAQLKGRLVHFASKEALDIANLGRETAAAMVDRGLVTRLPDLFHLDVDDVLQIEGFAERSARQLVDAVAESKRVELARFIYGLGVPEVGVAVARDLTQRFRSLDRLRNASREELETVPGVGAKMSEHIHEYLQETRTRETIDELLEAGICLVAPANKRETSCSGKTFVFTGSLERYTRSEAERVVESLGARATSSVSGQTDYVVAGENPGQKLADAEAEGVPVLDEEDLVEMLREAGHDLGG
jgi:DNA ligase (NAD+)